MHIPSGFLQPQVWITMTGISAAVVGYALKKSGDFVDERKTPFMGVMVAFIFAAQMVNFPVFSGTSGHLMGSALAVAILGMWPAMVVITSVVLVQALLFQDGGLDALGANVFNMGILGCILSGLIIGAGRKLNKKFYAISDAVRITPTLTGASKPCPRCYWQPWLSEVESYSDCCIDIEVCVRCHVKNGNNFYEEIDWDVSEQVGDPKGYTDANQGIFIEFDPAPHTKVNWESAIEILRLQKEEVVKQIVRMQLK